MRCISFNIDFQSDAVILYITFFSIQQLLCTNISISKAAQCVHQASDNTAVSYHYNMPLLCQLLKANYKLPRESKKKNKRLLLLETLPNVDRFQ